MTEHRVQALNRWLNLKPCERGRYQRPLCTTHKKLDELGLGGLYTIALLILEVFQCCTLYNNPCYFLNVHILAATSSAWLHGLKTCMIYIVNNVSALLSSLIFGAITCVTGLLGVVIGAATTRLCRQKTERADPLVCAVSMLGSAIFICLIFVVAKKSIVGAYVRLLF